MEIRFKLWLEDDGKVLFGQGRQELLEAIAQAGSLAGAAARLHMSYRAAWGRLRASEERLGFPLVEHGPRGKRAANLTPQARDLLDWYRELDSRTADFLREFSRNPPAVLSPNNAEAPQGAGKA